MARFERIIGFLCISVFLAIGLLLLADASTDFLTNHGFLNSRGNPERSFPKESYFAPRPYVMLGGTMDRELQSAAGLNRLGYRGPIPALPKPDGEYRVIMLGGSTVLAGDPPLPELVQARIDRAGMQRIRVYNFGVAASILRMDIARLLHEAADYHPDLVLFYGGGNGIIMPFQADPRPGYPPNYRPMKRIRCSRPAPRISSSRSCR